MPIADVSPLQDSAQTCVMVRTFFSLVFPIFCPDGRALSLRRLMRLLSRIGPDVYTPQMPPPSSLPPSNLFRFTTSMFRH